LSNWFVGNSANCGRCAPEQSVCRLCVRHIQRSGFQTFRLEMPDEQPEINTTGFLFMKVPPGGSVTGLPSLYKASAHFANDI